MQNDRILSMLGLAAKAGKVASGEFSTEKAVKSGKAFLVIVSQEASENTKKMFRNMCSYYKVPIYLYAPKEALGNAIGKRFRASLAVLDQGFARSLEEKLKLAEKTE
ncbi:MAG: 50S ribosomal protein L7ae [Lachnospiraceae bacterium]|nr:50S ribosomal protein L7ae [Lachnospiraceae bacterium]